MPIRDSQHDGYSRTIPARQRDHMRRGVVTGRKAGFKPGRYKFAAPIDSMERRLMFSVTLDANGWRVVAPTPGLSHMIYVSSSTGSDSNSGTIAAPVASLNQAETILKTLPNNEPNEILLKSGDTFNGAFLNWVFSGLDAQDPLLISYYNPTTSPVVLPVIDSGTNPAGFATPINQPTNNAAVNYVDIIGLNFQANLRNPSILNFSTSTAGGGTGFYFYNGGGNIVLEDDTFQWYRYNIDIEALEVGEPISNVIVSRCDDLDAYGANYAHSQGLYAYNISNLSVVQSVFDHNGWSSAVSTAEDLGFNHDIYIASTCSGIIVQQNVLAEAGFAGVMARAGGQIDNNLFVDDAIAVAYGQANGADSTPGGVYGTLSGNVMVGDKTYDDGQLYGQGFDIGNINPAQGLVVANNIITQDTENAKPAIQLDPATGTDNPSACVGINNVTIENNVTDSFREGIETDGRLESGVSPTTATIYAYNNVTVKNNDFINATAAEISHGNVWDAATESWSGDSYYDSVLSLTNWITVNSQTVPFSTWIASYDIGAKALPSLSVFPNPNVSIASYDATLGGSGTWAAFIANADTMNIANYQPQYLALAGDNYIEQGFGQPLDTSTGTGGTGGGTGTSTTGTASGPPSASAATLNLNDAALGTATYTFTVNYTDGNAIQNTSLGGGNLLVTGPSGFLENATYVSSTTPTVDANGYQHVTSTYQITAPQPSGVWAKIDGGTYTITMIANQVTDSLGTPVPAGVIGSFVADFTPPNAVASVTNINNSTQGSSPYSFSVTYSDSAGIDTTSLDSYSVKVTGPNSYSKYATVSNIITTGTTTTATYTVAAPGSTWTAGSYSVTLTAGTVSDLNGNTVSGGTLASFVSQTGNSTVGGTASITGTVFNDTNGDGLLDDRENTFTGVNVFIDLAGTGAYVATDPEAATNSSGVYTFTGLAAGQYTLFELAPAGYTVTSPITTANQVTLTAGQAATNANFANQLNTAVTSGTGTSTSNSSTGGLVSVNPISGSLVNVTTRGTLSNAGLGSVISAGIPTALGSPTLIAVATSGGSIGGGVATASVTTPKSVATAPPSAISASTPKAATAATV